MEYLFTEIDCETCGAVLGGVSGDTDHLEEYEAEVKDVLSHQNLCATCDKYAKMP